MRVVNHGIRKTLWIVVGCAVVSSGLLSVAAASDADSRRMDKQISLFERVLDDMLVESPNFLVRSSEVTHGSYIDGRGAVFSYKTRLNAWPWGGDHDSHRWWSWLTGDDDDDVIVINDNGRSSKKSRSDLREEALPRQEKLYKRGKKELVETLVDFGELLTVLDDTEWIEVTARLRGSEYFKENDLRKLTVSVQMRDIRSYVNGTLDEDDLAARVKVEES